MRSYSSYQVLLLSLVLSVLALALPFFPRVLVGVVSLILLPGMVLSSACFRDKGWLENSTIGLLLILVFLTIFGGLTLTFLKSHPFWVLLVLYFVTLGVIDLLLRRGASGKIDLSYKLEKYDKRFVGLLALLLVSVAFQSYFIGFESGGDFVSKFTRNDHWYYASSSAVVKNEGLSGYPVYPHLPLEKDRYPVGSFVLFGILSVLLNIPTLYLVQYLGVLVPLGLSLAFYYGGQLFFREKRAAFFAFLFGSFFHLGWSFFFSPISWYRYQGLPIPVWVVPLCFTVGIAGVWLLGRLYTHSKRVFLGILIVGGSSGLILAQLVLKWLSTKLAVSMAWLIPILYYDWTYDSSFAGMLPLQVFFVTISPKALSFLYQALVLLVLYKLAYEKDLKKVPCWQGLLFLSILLMSVSHSPSVVPFGLFLGVLVAASFWYKKARLWVWPILLGGGVSGLYIGYYALSVAPGQRYLELSPNLLYGLVAFIVFYGFHLFFSYFGIQRLRKGKKEILGVLLLFVLVHWVYVFLVKNTFNPSDMGRVFSSTLIPLAFLSAAGVARFNQRAKAGWRVWKTGAWIALVGIGACYFLIYPLTFSPLQPNQYVVPRADVEAYQWIRVNTDPQSIFVVSLNDSEYNPHELTVFGERKTLADSPWNLKLYGYPKEVVDARLALVKEVYDSGLSKKSLSHLRTYVDQNIGEVPLYILVGSHELERYPNLHSLAVDAKQVVFNNKESVLVQV